MDSQDKNARPERANTDHSLQAERDKADAALTKHASANQTDADQVVELARERADSVLETARQKADATLRQVDGPTEAAKGLFGSCRRQDRGGAHRATAGARAAPDA
jgi:cell division septum initiation protein DivIVA